MKSIKTMAVSSVFILTILLLGAGLLLVTPYLASIGGSGMTINSITTSKVMSNDADVEGTWFNVFTTLRGGHHMYGIISPSQFKSESGYETEQRLKVEASTTDETVTYNIINDQKPIYKYVMTEMDVCPSNTDYKILLRDKWFGIIVKKYYLCVDKKQYAVKGSFTNPTVGFSSDLSVTVGSEKITQEVSNLQKNVDFEDKFGNLLAQAAWSGSLMTGDPTPNQDNYIAYFHSRNFGENDRWRVAKKDSYTEYIASMTTTDSQLQQYVAHPNDFTCEPKTYAGCVRTIENVIDTPNRKMNTILNSDYKIADTQNTYNIESENNAKIKVWLDRTILNPTITWRIKADWLGVVIPVSEPKIVSVSSDEFGSGEDGKIVVRVKNDGDVDADFTSSFYGCDPFEMKYSAPSTHIEKGQTKTVNLYVSTGNTNVDVSKSCTVKVCDANKASNCDTKSVQVSMTRAKVCTLNVISIEGSCIYKCTDETKQPVQQVCCDYGIGYDKDKADTYDGYYCKTVPGDECETDADCDDNVDETKDWCETDFFGKKTCVHKNINACRSDVDCNDNDWLTYDTCKKTIIGGVVGSDGMCSHLDLRPIFAILGTITFIIGLIVVALFGLGVTAILKRK